MHPRVEELPTPAPDFRRFLSVLRREPVGRVPLIELGIHQVVVDALLETEPVDTASPDHASETLLRSLRVQHRLGYDMVKVSAPIPWVVHRLRAEGGAATGTRTIPRAWADEHTGPIKSNVDVDRYPWPSIQDVDFRSVDVLVGALPDGMALLGFSGGVLEFTMDLLGMEPFMVASIENPTLVETVVERVGQTIYEVFDAYCGYDAVKALWLGDDLGHKTGLLVSPRLLETLIFPWYRRYVDLAHASGRPFMLHTCGNTAAVMETLVEDIGIDAKHSYEDVIEPVERFADRWGDQLAVLGGVDVHLLAVGDEQAIRDRVRTILNHVVPRCSYAAGSGNSIPDYVPAPHYLAMVEAVHEFNREWRG